MNRGVQVKIDFGTMLWSDARVPGRRIGSNLQGWHLLREQLQHRSIRPPTAGRMSSLWPAGHRAVRHVRWWV